MFSHKQIGFFAVITAMSLGLLACGLQGIVPSGEAPVVEESADTPASAVGLPNPAAVYCQGLGYTMEPREVAGGQDAACIFPDGTEGQLDAQAPSNFAPDLALLDAMVQSIEVNVAP